MMLSTTMFPASTEDVELLPLDALTGGQDFGPYRVHRLLGRGGMADVFEAEDCQTGQQVALKRPRPDRATRRVFERFTVEVDLTCQLDHPHLVHAVDADCGESPNYLALELLSGCTLADLVSRHGPLSVPMACRLAGQVAEALDALHRRGIVHRDVQPGNLMWCEGRGVVLIDLGLARRLDRPELLGHERSVVGTPCYFAPEQWHAPQEVSTAADLYALGGVLWFLLTGEPVNIHWLFDSIENRSPLPVGRLGEDVPAELVRLLEQLLAADPHDRPTHAQEVVEALERWSHGMDESEIDSHVKMAVSAGSNCPPPAVTYAGNGSKGPLETVVGQA